MISETVTTKPYDQAIGTGLYEKQSGLRGKYDNVREYWEDEVTCHFLSRYVSELAEDLKKKGRKLRCLDLGCGQGDGYRLLMKTRQQRFSSGSTDTRLLSDDMLEHYLGIDINTTMIERARAIFSGNEKLSFQAGDFAGGLPLHKPEAAFDIYFTSYGTLSHNQDDETAQILADIALHFDRRALIIGDWLGRYSYEWQELWTYNHSQRQTMDYAISYLRTGKDKDAIQPEPFRLRLMSPGEIERIVRKAEKISGRSIRILEFFDRSLMVGRHMDTGDYNKYCQPIRSLVNSLFEPDTRTDLSKLIIAYHEMKGFSAVDNVLKKLTESWNLMVNQARKMLDDQYGNPQEKEITPWSHLAELAKTLEARSCKSFLTSGCEIRSSIMEPFLAFSLRDLEITMQQGGGMGHGLIAILEVKK
jgi:SAM-dependent methyltransferase